MESSVRKLFERYESVFNRSLGGDMDMDEVASLYASEFIAASPAGIMAGRNDDQLKEVMAQGYARYRALGRRQCGSAMSVSLPWMTVTAWRMSTGRRPMPARTGRTSR